MLKYIFVLITVLSLLGYPTFIGVAYHLDIDAPEYSGNNPMFILRGEYKNGFCEYISSIPDREQGYGLNMCGVGVRF